MTKILKGTMLYVGLLNHYEHENTEPCICCSFI